MCDYSLMLFPNRLARNGDELMLRRFSSGSLGLVSCADVQQIAAKRDHSFWGALKDFFLPEPEPVAVCIPPSSSLKLRAIPRRWQMELEVQAEEEVVFRQIGAEARTYRDAVQFRNGRIVRLQELQQGQRVTVLNIGDLQPQEGDLANLPQQMTELVSPIDR